MHPRDDIALHLSPVFSPPPRVVRNSIQQQQWGPEESHGDPFPLVAGQPFEILVLVEHDHYKIAINGAHYAEFRHRLPVHRVTHVAIDGEVSVGMLHFEGSVQSSSHGGYPKHKSSLPIPISGNLGKGLAVGAGALAGAALLKKVNPLKPKKMFKHKHKHGWKGWSSSSSSSSSEEE
ncbi:galectin, putative [Ixodes scapularis]|uniref:Galectin n=1 Tax=Ixodes scapularis TaxID=6945 RepID=B7Q2V3_IXOSC|nr:galectin, putative [Ixodes scapularis]|eukprot:XP_002411050.1 galectin, putative [Ixodes scapularis]